MNKYIVSISIEVEAESEAEAAQAACRSLSSQFYSYAEYCDSLDLDFVVKDFRLPIALKGTTFRVYDNGAAQEKAVKNEPPTN